MSTSPESPKPYLCYQCNRIVSLTTSDLHCPLCNSDFLEEHHPDPDPLSDHLSSLSLSDPPILLSSTSTSVDLANPIFFSHPLVHPQTALFSPFFFLQNHLLNLRQDGADVQFVIENHPSHPGFRLPSNIGDYFLGPGLEHLIHQLSENDPNRYGTPPASKKAVETLPSVEITEELVADSDSGVQCAVCMSDFEVGLEAKQMPCKHIFHCDCILPWLELHNSCPVCRFELPTDDPDYESRKGGSTSSDSERGGGDGGSERSQSVERRFRISLPWPLNFMVAGGGDNEGGGSGSGDQHGSEHGQGEEQDPRGQSSG